MQTDDVTREDFKILKKHYKTHGRVAAKVLGVSRSTYQRYRLQYTDIPQMAKRCIKGEVARLVMIEDQKAA